MNLRPLGDRLIVEDIPEAEMTAGGIVLPEMARDRERAPRAKVLAVGPGTERDDGSMRPIDIREGDIVLYSRFGGTAVKSGDDEFVVLRESDVLVVEEVEGDS